MASELQEVIISLKSQIDNTGMQKLLSYLDTTKLKALGITAALTGVTTAVYKFIESATKEELRLEKLAAQQKKTIETTRASEQALKTMNMTLNDINKDKNLKTIYEDLVKFNSSLALPDMKGAIEKINGLRSAFWKLKSAVGYAVQWINARVLANLEEPINRITNKLNKISAWVQKNLSSITSKISSYITGFAKGIIGIVEGLEKVAKFVNELPEGIKRAGTAIGLVFGLLKSGPIGQILTMITAIGGLIDDYENFMYNKANGFKKGDKGYVDTALTGIWELLSDDGKTAEEKGNLIAEKLFGGLIAGLNNLADSLQFENIFGDGSEGGEGLISKATSWINDHSELFEGLAQALLRVISNGFETVAGTAGGGIGWLINQLLGDGTVPDEVFNDGGAGSSFALAVGGFVGGFLEKAKDKNSTLFQKILEGMKGAGIGALIGSLIADGIDEEGNINVDWEAVGVDLKTVGQAIFNIFSSAVTAAGDIGSTIFGLLGTSIEGVKIEDHVDGLLGSIGKLFDNISKNETLSDGISAAAATLFAGGNFVESLIVGLFGSYTGAREDAMRNAIREKYKEKGGLLGVILDEESLNGMSGAELENAFNSVFEGEDKPDILRGTFANLGDAAGTLITDIWDVIMKSASGVNGLGATLFSKLFDAIGNLLGVGALGEGLGDNTIIGGLATALGTKIAGGGFFLSIFTGLFSTITTAADKVTGDQTLWDVLEKDALEIWDKVQDVWYGPIENGERNENKGLVSIFKKLFGGENEGFDLKSKVIEWLSPVGDAIEAFFSALWIRIYNTAPQWLQDALGFAFIDDPNRSTIEEINGKKILKDSHNREHELTEEEYNWLMSGSARDLEKEGYYTVAIDKEGNIYGTGSMKYSDSGNIDLAVRKNTINQNRQGQETAGETDLTGEPKKETPGYKTFKDEHTGKIYTLQTDEYGQINWENQRTFGYVRSEGDYSFKELSKEEFVALGDAVKKAVTTLTLVEKVESAATKTEGSLNAFESNVESAAEAAADFANSVGSVEQENAYGGRISGKHRNMTVGEDGTEYIIPITKPQRAMSLINQMLAEMGLSASNRVMSGLGVEAGNIGSSISSALDMIGGSSNNMYNISAPVSIVVNANGADGASIGKSAYDAAEQHLYKTIRGVFA